MHEDFVLREINCCSKCSVEMSDEPEIEIGEQDHETLVIDDNLTSNSSEEGEYENSEMF